VSGAGKARHRLYNKSVQSHCSASRVLRTFTIPLSWTDLVTRTLKETSADNELGAAQLA
jgi:hypothetical protein